MFDFDKIQIALNNGATWRDLTNQFGICQAAISRAKRDGLIKTKSMSEAIKLSRVKNPIKHTVATKQKLSEIRKKFLANNPDKVPYLTNHSSKQSYPEAYFAEVFKQEGLEVIPEFKVETFQIDFALPLRKFAIEIDGEQHYVDARIVEHDKKRTERLSSLGWKVKRIRWAEYQRLNFDEKKKFVRQFIEGVTE